MLTARILIFTCFVFCGVNGSGLCQGVASKSPNLTSYIIDSSLPRTGLTQGFSRPTLYALIDFLRNDQSMISKIDLSDEERKQLQIAISQLDSLVEYFESQTDDIDEMLTRLSTRSQIRLESIATSIDGLERIPIRLKFNHVSLSKASIDRIGLMRKKFITEKAGPLISTEFGSSPSNEDTTRIAVAQVKCKIEFGLQLVSSLSDEEVGSVSSFLELSEQERQLRNYFLQQQYTMRHGPLLRSDLLDLVLSPK